MTERQERPPPCHAACSSHVLMSLFPFITYVVLPAGVLALVEVGDAYLLLFLGHVLLAIGAVEWSWLAFRICQRLLLAVVLHEEALAVSAATATGAVADEIGQSHRTQQTQNFSVENEEIRRLRALEEQSLRREDLNESYTLLLNETMRAKSFAIAPLTNRVCSGRWYLGSFVLATVGAGVSLSLGYALETTVFESKSPASGWRMMVAASVEAAFVSIFCSSLAPSGADALVLVVYQACFLVASMNAYLKLHVNVITSDAQLDPLFIILAGAIIIIVSRVVTSKVVIQSLLHVMCDVLGLVCIVSPLIAFVDLIDQTMNDQFRNQFALFLLVVLAADVGNCLAKQLQLRRPEVFKYCRNSQLKFEATTEDLEALLISLMCGATMIAIIYLGLNGEDYTTVEVIVLIGAITLGQWCRLWMVHVRQMAKVSTSAFYFPEGSQTCGVLDRMTVFLVAIIVYYPYIKQKYFS
ncbi:uncharacterized protein PHALS_10798 [Plasmopara halstedii]|uniref:Uncharacterized protein n=1 Tax=Plasmopara halstedii TaxID=4781 RepID=A0A0P1AJ98_PLAHL|nr:uncharacterized protein PHALS_10798 [Plasmopara halstedii]CEG40612.1 hypothetical protein PHALS_10798 [Plasmopara halstedii]|eukprot:XP_024576981.1 hypothetical protein PHALS_10798 [Plasmopara halstedii]